VEDVLGAVVGRVEGAEVGVDAFVVVAEGLVAEGEALAAAAAGTDVSAIDGWHGFSFVVQGGTPPGFTFWKQVVCFVGVGGSGCFQVSESKRVTGMYFIRWNLAVLWREKQKGCTRRLPGAALWNFSSL
jgi:hypothetical protein